MSKSQRQNRGQMAADARKTVLAISQIKDQMAALTEMSRVFQSIIDEAGIKADTPVEIDGATKFDRACKELRAYTENVMVAISRARVQEAMDRARGQ